MKTFTFSLLLALLLSSCNKHSIQSQYVLLDPIWKSIEYPGGIEELKKYIQECVLMAPRQYTGMCFVNIRLSKSGKVEEAYIIKSTCVDKDAEEYALKIALNLPKFEPAMLYGDSVRSSSYIRIDYDCR